MRVQCEEQLKGPRAKWPRVALWKCSVSSKEPVRWKRRDQKTNGREAAKPVGARCCKSFDFDHGTRAISRLAVRRMLLGNFSWDTRRARRKSPAFSFKGVSHADRSIDRPFLEHRTAFSVSPCAYEKAKGWEIRVRAVVTSRNISQ